MDSVVRAVAVYFFLLVVFRIAGKRSMSEITTFDFVLLLIVAETAQQALIGDDYSLTTAWVLIATLFVTETGMTLLKRKMPRVDRILEGEPVLIVQDGRVIEASMAMERVDVDDILEAARRRLGIDQLGEIKFAVIERDGSISVIPNGQPAQRREQP